LAVSPREATINYEVCHTTVSEDILPAPKLMAIENEFLREKDALLREIKRQRGEVGGQPDDISMPREVEELVTNVRSQPPPPTPEREGEKQREDRQRGGWSIRNGLRSWKKVWRNEIN
jgi:hypothetical protein